MVCSSVVPSSVGVERPETSKGVAVPHEEAGPCQLVRAVICHSSFMNLHSNWGFVAKETIFDA